MEPEDFSESDAVSASSAQSYEAVERDGSRKRRRTSDDGRYQEELREPVDLSNNINNAPSRVSGTQKNPGLAPIKSEKKTFSELNVDAWLVASLSAMAITKPTPIQRGCIPEILKGRDCVGVSRTGSGKTVAFAVPILQKWAEDPIGIFAVVLTPTR